MAFYGRPLILNSSRHAAPSGGMWTRSVAMATRAIGHQFWTRFELLNLLFFVLPGQDKMSNDVFLISSGESDDSLPPVTFATRVAVQRTGKKTISTCKTAVLDPMYSDEDEILPLFERIAKKTELSQARQRVRAEETCKSSSSSKQALDSFRFQEHPTSKPGAALATKHKKCFELSSSDEDLPDIKECKPKEKHAASSTDSDGCEPVVETINAKPKRKAVSKSGKSDAEVVARKEELRRQREEKTAALQREKIQKQIQAQQLRCMKPGECIRFVKAIMDLSLLEMPEAEEIPKVFAEAGVQYTLSEQLVPRSIMWVRQVDLSAVDCNNKVDTVTRKEEENQTVVLMPVKEFLAAVHQFKQVQMGAGEGRTLHSIVSQLKELLHGKALTLFICGIQKYFQQLRSKQQREYRTNILDDVQTQGKPKRARKHKELDIEVSRVDVEEALVDLQIREPCNVRLLDSPMEVAQVVASFTKAIAESPYKQSKDDGGTFSWLASDDTGKTVKVDKSGSGLLLLWQRQIEQFHMVSVDVAQAITAQYSSPTALITAYSRCNNPKECEKLLQDIVVRRGVGPLATMRRIGPELSRKLYIMLTSTDGTQLLDAS